VKAWNGWDGGHTNSRPYEWKLRADEQEHHMRRRLEASLGTRRRSYALHFIREQGHRNDAVPSVDAGQGREQDAEALPSMDAGQGRDQLSFSAADRA